MEWKIIALDEQKTLLDIDYHERKITVYTNRKSVGNRLKKKVGEPTKIYEEQGKIVAVEYTRSLLDKDTPRFFSKMLLIGAYRD